MNYEGAARADMKPLMPSLSSLRRRLASSPDQFLQLLDWRSNTAWNEEVHHISIYIYIYIYIVHFLQVQGVLQHYNILRAWMFLTQHPATESLHHLENSLEKQRGFDFEEMHHRYAALPPSARCVTALQHFAGL